MPTLWEIEAEFIRLIARMKHNGIKVDEEFCLPKIHEGEKILNGIQKELGWNPGSTKDIGHFLLDVMKFPVVKRTEKGNPSFDKHAMAEYEEMLEYEGSDVAQQILTFRGYQKTVSSNYKAYIKLMDEKHILHPNYKVHGTRTCRTSCENPNLQQIPRSSPKPWNGDVKKAFIPRGDTVLVEFDASQVEFRLMAAIARETELLEAFWDGEDVFKVMAARLAWERQDVKTLVYATSYGAGVPRISMIFKISKGAAKKRIDEFFDSYPRLRIIAENAQQLAKNDKYIEYWTGRRRHLNGSKGQEYHKAFNAAIQGGAFEIIKRCGIRLAQEISSHWPMVLTVHDSYVLEFPAADYTNNNVHKVKSILEAVPETKEMGVPFKWEPKVWGTSE